MTIDADGETSFTAPFFIPSKDNSNENYSDQGAVDDADALADEGAVLAGAALQTDLKKSNAVAAAAAAHNDGWKPTTASR